MPLWYKEVLLVPIYQGENWGTGNLSQSKVM